MRVVPFDLQRIQVFDLSGIVLSRVEVTVRLGHMAGLPRLG